MLKRPLVLLLYLHFFNACSMHFIHINFDSKVLISFQNTWFKFSLKVLTSFYSICYKITLMLLSQYEIYTDTDTYTVCNIIAESRMWYQMFSAPPYRKRSCSESSRNKCYSKLNLGCYIYVQSNLHTPFSYATDFYLTKLEISGHGRSNYLLLLSSRMQEKKKVT